MAGKESGITLDDIMAYAKQSQEIGLKYKVSGDQHLMHLLASTAREAQAAFGEDGLKMIERAVARFGEERGKRIAQLVEKDGRPLTVMNFFLFSDLDTSGNEMVPEFIDGELRVSVTRCRLYDKLCELGLQMYAKHYCGPIDQAILRGYNPRLELEITSHIAAGADCCQFVYRQPPASLGEV